MPSESESGTSSSSEVDGAKASVRMNTEKEPAGSGANIEQKKINLGNSIKRKRESAPPERQSSPDHKLYRAALLRSCFTDTIRKAQEKTTLGKDEKQGPEKLRLEKEELER